jgi:hypothetical protein
MRRNQFLAVWDAHFAQVREKELRGHPRARSLRAISVRSDHKAGETHWRKNRAYYHSLSEPLTIDTLAAAIRFLEGPPTTPTPRLQDYVRIFHADCGGIVIGPLDNLTCAECGQQMKLEAARAEG